MSRWTTYLLGTVASWFMCALVLANDPLLHRKSGEGTNHFVSRILPRGSKLVHPVVEGDFGPSNNNIVILFRRRRYTDFDGWVLVPQKEGYRKFVLPKLNPDSEPFMGLRVKSVFFEDADHQRGKELILLLEYPPGYAHAFKNDVEPAYYTAIYRWDNGRFVDMEDLSSRIEAKTKAEVSKQLKGPKETHE